MEENQLLSSTSVYNPCSILLLKSLDTTSKSYRDHQSFASEFHKITNIPIQRFPQDEVVMVEHLHFIQASTMTNPGRRCFIS